MDRAVNLSLIKQDFPSSLDEMKKKAVEMIEETIVTFGARLSNDGEIKAACLNYAKKTAHTDELQARSFARTLPKWNFLPDQWAVEVIAGHAAKTMRKEAGLSQHIVSAVLLSPYGVVVASTILSGRPMAG